MRTIKPVIVEATPLGIKNDYPSPRWSGEIMDCSMPLTFDQYSRCSYNCLYCFSYFQKALKAVNPIYHGQQNYLTELPSAVNKEEVKRIWAGNGDQFEEYIKRGITFQWGGLSDPFDEFERKYGVGLNLMQFFSGIQYPICFSTKGTWWTQDERYTSLFAHGKWNVKVSIINADDALSKRIELGAPSPSERLAAIERINDFNPKGKVTLRLRPFIIGMSDIDYEQLIYEAAHAGASAVSTEFFCLEGRAAADLKNRYEKMSEVLGYDVYDFYRKNSTGSGYLRLNWKIKQPYIDHMQKLCDKLGLRFYVSDAHCKDRCAGGSCCGLETSKNYQRSQLTEVLYVSKKRYDKYLASFPSDVAGAEKASEVTWTELMADVEVLFGSFLWRHAKNFNTTGCTKRTKLYHATMADYIKNIWNDPNDLKSPYKYFSGLMRPRQKTDKHGDVVYYYTPYKM